MGLMIIYLDVLISVNFILNYAVLRASAQITGQKRNRPRSLTGAVLGAAYAAICVFAGKAISSLPFRIFVGVLMSLTAFGINKRTLRTTLFFFGISAAFAGIVFALSYIAGDKFGFIGGNVYINLSLPLLAVTTAIAYLLLTIIFRPAALKNKTPKKFMEAEIKVCEKRASFLVLLDTGCTLLDPVTNKNVLVSNINSVSPVLDPVAVKAMKEGVDATEIITKFRNHSPPFRLIFCKSVSGLPDMLPAFVPDCVTLDGEDMSGILVAVTAVGLDGDDNVRAIIGADVL